MELLHVLGNTWAAVAATALLPVYKLTDRDVVLIDTGYAKLDRAGLTSLIDANGWRLRAILCSHAHFDHTGNVHAEKKQQCRMFFQRLQPINTKCPDSINRQPGAI